VVLEGNRKEEREEGEGILGQGEDTILAGHHMAYPGIQGPEDPGDHRGPNHQAGEGRMGGIERAVQMEDHPEDHQEGEGPDFGHLVVVLVGFGVGPALELALQSEIRSAEIISISNLRQK
jgi:hypothetical protein